MICPLARVIRVADALPKSDYAQEYFDRSTTGYPLIADLLVRIRAENLCSEEMAADPRDLMFEPTPVDLGLLMVGAASR